MLTELQQWGIQTKTEVQKIALQVKKNETEKKQLRSWLLLKNVTPLAATSLGAQPSEIQWIPLLSESFKVQQQMLREILSKERLKVIPLEDPSVVDAMNAEAKVLQWLNSSLQVLFGALDQLKSKPEQYMSASMLIGKLPLSQDFHWQINCFNLEINIIKFMDVTKGLNLIVYDHQSELNHQFSHQALGSAIKSAPKLNTVLHWKVPDLVKLLLELWQNITNSRHI